MNQNTALKVLFFLFFNAPYTKSQKLLDRTLLRSCFFSFEVFMVHTSETKWPSILNEISFEMLRLGNLAYLVCLIIYWSKNIIKKISKSSSFDSETTGKKIAENYVNFCL